MKASNKFKEVIKEYLDNLAQKDELFRVTYAKPNKSLDECVNYILQEVKALGVNGMDDSEVFGMAVHYYDEDDLKAEPLNMQVVVNRVGEITEADKEALKAKALKDYIDLYKNSKEFKEKAAAIVASEVELTEEEKAIARELAIREEISSAKTTWKKKDVKKGPENVTQASLF